MEEKVDEAHGSGAPTVDFWDLVAPETFEGVVVARPMEAFFVLIARDVGGSGRALARERSGRG